MSATRPELKFAAVSEEHGFYRRFVSLPEKPDTTLRIVDRGEYYTVVGSDAIFVAENVYHTQSVLKNCNVDPSVAKRFNQPLQYVTMSPQVVSSLLKTCLVDLAYKVEIYDKSWKMLKTASPGNIEQVSDLMNINVDTSIVIAAIKPQLNSQDGNCLLGVTFIDTSNYKIGMLDIVDNEVYSNLESFLIQLGVRECLLPDLTKSEGNMNEIKKITGVIDRCGCVATFVRNSDFSDKDSESDLAKLIGDELSISLPQKFSKFALSSFNALVHYLELLQEQDQLGKYELIQHSLKELMKLDASAMKALNLFPATSSQSIVPLLTAGYSNSNSSKVTSLFQLLNHCKTNAGVRLLNEWIKQPLTSLAEITKRHDLVEYLIDQLELRQILQTDFLPVVPDIRRITKKLNKNGNLEDILKLYQFCIKIPEISKTLESFLEDSQTDENIKTLVKESWLDPMLSYTSPLSKLQEMVETTVDLDAYEEHNEFMIKVEFNEELAKIRQELDMMRDQIHTAHIQASEDLGFDPDKKLKLENHHLHGWCMRLTRNDGKELRKHEKYIELSTVKAGIYFSTSELREVARETSLLQKEYDRQQSALVKEIVNITLTYTPVLEKISIILANLDVICSFAHASSYAVIPYIRPKMYDIGSERKTRLISSRHPVLEMQDDLTFIANDVNLEKGTSDFLIITGPNMGGKSTYIRQVGVITLMAQIGCFVPCDEADIAIVDAILCRVGAGDSQLKGVSTFMVEMLETASILKNASTNSLIIIDELGRGTSTYDGFGLAWAISEFIASQIKCFALFATHFHELTSLSDKLSNVKNMQVVAHIEQNADSNQDKDDITLLYKVEPGVSDQSFGIHVAEVVQFPDKIVKMAKRKVEELEDLKDANEKLKKTRLSPKEINEGNNELKKILKEWSEKIKLEGIEITKLTDQDCQQRITELLKNVTQESEKNHGEYLTFIKEMLL
ncbi:hypothetical protein Kpol_1053p38 [Vanderwaltozyma polyspora DSM 70294]|uniref:DNA mismatch repair protein MSH2 n=1 Tax=Vanderwaltozyma polyspora (strain ATCC 22028 / DSM 70294 / BCRC 21397 / CBS 2163 / NBRC 10782 / NRRL Y-8283 / UCD 57-17) TaxID=436907 RepID=A7TN82_VANPO|nr:uncharacterized protein Kpol_1053p38 [Vanderwaltozyma polyspora DSM 70294]EDO16300.1 hypothetical protein Kpol_1053p38 [Vanderwaltozyma polyspora DSM 70294]